MYIYIYIITIHLMGKIQNLSTFINFIKIIDSLHEEECYQP